MFGHFGNNAVEVMKRKSKPKKKNIELLLKYLTKSKKKENGITNR